MIKHKKTSGLANTADATLVQPTDWNASHAYALDSIVLLGTVSFGLAGTTVEYEINNDCPYIGTITRLAAGSYSLAVDVASAEDDLLAVGHTLSLFAHLSVMPRQALPSATRFTSMPDGATILLDVMNGSFVNINPPVDCDACLTVYGRVVAV